MSRRKTSWISATLTLLWLLPFNALGANPSVKMETSVGDFTLELFPEQAPITVKNFLAYVESGHYNDTIFHRVIQGFMIQGGGFDDEMVKKATNDPIANESNNGLKNETGTIAMARTAAPNSATAQFFINLADNPNLNGEPGKPGYAVFGKVSSGMDTVNVIALQRTHTVGMYRDVPIEPIVIERAVLVVEEEAPVTEAVE